VFVVVQALVAKVNPELQAVATHEPQALLLEQVCAPVPFEIAQACMAPAVQAKVIGGTQAPLSPCVYPAGQPVPIDEACEATSRTELNSPQF
jgi:hypothetical protein